ncbi:MAG TPA: hypothetical protein VFR07_05950 [Mycobacteriales bacterium]|nr:hypothetical protein [Mycobacteriales bacterium]
MAAEYRLKRGPILILLLVVGVVGALLVARSSVRPEVDVYSPVTVPAAYDGTTYAFDGLLCLRASSIGVTVDDVSSSGGTRLGLRPAGAPVTVAFPVEPDALAPLVGATVPAGDQVCTRLLLTAAGSGDRRAEPVRLAFRYGPFGVLRRSVTVTPPATLQVTGSGTDPRTTA